MNWREGNKNRARKFVKKYGAEIQRRERGREREREMKGERGKEVGRGVYKEKEINGNGIEESR